MKKNDIYEITIDDIGNDGEGIGHIYEDGTETGSHNTDVAGREDGGLGTDDRTHENGMTIFVKDTIVGDVIKVRIVKVKKRYAYGRLEEILKPSPYRVDAMCPKARQCGGCVLMHMDYQKQLEYKWNKVKNCLERIGGIADAGALMEPVCGMENPYHYRNKMQFPVGLSKDGMVEIGFYAGRTHSIINLDSCAIGHPVNDFLISAMRGWLQKKQNQYGNFIYDETTHTGLVRHILTRVGFSTGELMVCVVINGNRKQFGGNTVEEEWTDCIRKAVEEYNESVENMQVDDKSEVMQNANNVCGAFEPTEQVMDDCLTPLHGKQKIALKSLTLNYNTEKTNRILGNRCDTLYGAGYITDYIGDIRFKISPLSFYQVNPAQTKVLYDKAVSYAGLTGDEVVWDMYCGIGTISLCLAKHARKVYGVEIVPQAIDDARENAACNGIENATFFCGKAEEVVPAFYDGTLDCAMSGDRADAEDMQDGRHPDVVVVDPPRKGCDSTLLDTIEQMQPKRLVYVSCDPATLARDIAILVQKGFVLEKVGVVDQFGHSGHIECVTLLQRKNT